MANYELAFIGAGNMAEAIARGVIAAGLLRAEQMIATDPADGRRKVFADLGVATSTDNRAVAASAGRILLAVKPQMMKAVLAELAEALPPTTPVISIAAGWSTAKIEAGLAGEVQESGGQSGPGAAAALDPHPNPPPKREREKTPEGAVPQSEIRDPKSEIRNAFRVVRVMPNTPMLAGAGMSVLVKGSQATDADLAWARRLFDAGGQTIVVADEKLIDAVTAVSGSGPAYFFYLIEWMVAAGGDEGLSPADALKLATQTCLGAAKLLADSGESPRELRRRVTSPAGTTQAACDLLDARGVAEAIRDAVRAAATRSRELGA